MVQQKTELHYLIHRIVEYMDLGLYPAYQNAGKEELGQALYAMYCAAVNAQNVSHVTAPKFDLCPMDKPGLLEAYGAVLKIIHECSYSDIPSWDLYKRLVMLKNNLAEAVIAETL